MKVERNKVHPADLLANGLWNPFTGRKKYTIRCGACEHSYDDKVPFNMGDTASSICFACGSQNIWSHGEFQRGYNRSLAAPE